MLLNLNLLFTTDRQEEGDICIRMYKIGTSLIENVLSSSYENISSEMLCPKYKKKYHLFFFVKFVYIVHIVLIISIICFLIQSRQKV